MTKIILKTSKIMLREATLNDRDYIVALLTDDDWQHYIGDRGVFDQSSAKTYIENTLLASYRTFGYGLWVVESYPGQQWLGLCGLIQRTPTAFPELGYAMLPHARGKGYCMEACKQVIGWAKDREMDYLFATTTPDNVVSQHILTHCGFAYSQQQYVDNQPLHTFKLNLKTRA